MKHHLELMVLHMAFIKYAYNASYFYLLSIGIGGLQWKKQLKNKVEVTINEISPLSVSDIRDNCERNGMTVEAMRLPEGLDVHQTIQSNEPTDNGIELTSADANVIMHLRQFGFM